MGRTRQVAEEVRAEVDRLLTTNNKMTIDLTTVEGRMAARMYATVLAAEGQVDLAEEIFKRVGREG
jgi:hypothetical protein